MKMIYKINFFTRSVLITLFSVLVVSFFSQTPIVYSENNLWGLKNADGKVIIKPKYNYIWGFNEGLALVNTGGEPGYDEGIYGGEFGFIDSTGKEIIPVKYTTAAFFKNGLAIVSVKGKFGFINKKGQPVIPIKYGMVKEFHEGLASVNIGMKYETSCGHDRLLEEGKWGFADSKGRIVIPVIYNAVADFNEGKAEVKLDNRTFFIDKEGKEIN